MWPINDIGMRKRVNFHDEEQLSFRRLYVVVYKQFAEEAEEFSNAVTLAG